MQQIFEFIMMACFGVSWPLSVYKSYKARTATGKSFLFLMAIEIGYISGILGKIVTNNINYVLVVYIINFIMVSADVALYFRNKQLDKKAAVK